MELVRRNILPRDILTENAFRNGIAVDMAIGGSTNTVLHLLAIAHEAEVKLDINLFDEISKRTPKLCPISSRRHLLHAGPLSRRRHIRGHDGTDEASRDRP